MCCISSKHISWKEETSKNLIQYETRDQVQEETIDHQGDNSLFYFVLMLKQEYFPHDQSNLSTAFEHYLMH